jgi:hypothetical protein
MATRSIDQFTTDADLRFRHRSDWGGALVPPASAGWRKVGKRLKNLCASPNHDKGVAPVIPRDERPTLEEMRVRLNMPDLGKSVRRMN